MAEGPRTVRDDVALIEDVLREVLQDEVGLEFLVLADRFREDARGLHGPASVDADRRLREVAQSLSLEQASAVARAFSFHFLLLNLV
ncbi:MAG: phosphoenolpyruvate carboxylase, partial [Thermoplasmata archaeon]